VAAALKTLEHNNMTYTLDGALWFRSTQFGDDKDRVLRKSDGEYTYVAADTAYLKNKADRGFDHLIMVLGHDHHSYVTRLAGLRQALALNPSLTVILYQLVSLKEGDEQFKMSKRAGKIVSLNDVINTVGPDVARFFYLNKKADAQLEFDISLALKKTEENPVYYVQYAYVRTKSILAKADAETALRDITINDVQHMGESERLLLKKIASLQALLESISHNHQTHTLAYYAIELAQAWHSYYAKNRVIDPNAIEQSRGRLLLIMTLRNTFETVMKLLGISCPESM
jgi:arginyl-tRNA synthetase